MTRDCNLVDDVSRFPSDSELVPWRMTWKDDLVSCTVHREFHIDVDITDDSCWPNLRIF